jgi:hypothetical protein
MKKGLKISERYYRLIILVFQREFGAAEIYGGKMLGGWQKVVSPKESSDLWSPRKE